ncbi:hypothetical protein CASFOL_005703 [Castilleja foliolosa]|uniref:KIB1-4 beta-propeller domain-containing protein n=1 Tax=Castilleja foliolosa TaxID=1961234 RepID=A0ABD3E870_9LAMI
MVSFVSRLKGSAVLRLPFLLRAPTMSAAMSTVSSRSIKTPPDELLTSSKTGPSPWLMLPPKAGMVCKFYNLVEDRIESFGVELPDSDDAVLVGSSHGWLAFFNRRNNHVFLSNPLSGTLLKLPSIESVETDSKFRCRLGTVVSKLVLSSSPERDDCIAMICFEPGKSPYLWSRGSGSAHWTDVHGWFYESKKLFPDGPDRYTDARTYEDIVYCSSRKKFGYITEFQIAPHDCGEPLHPSQLEEHDLRGFVSHSLRHLMNRAEASVCEKCYFWLRENETLLKPCAQIPYLWFNEQRGELYILTRFLNAGHKTVGFFAFKIVYNEHGAPGDLILVDSLDGLAVFVGLNHTFAVSSPAEFGLKSDSIYFTDAANARVMPPAIHGHDNGIFDFVNKTLSPCPGPDYDDAQTLSTPVWFTPSP